MLSAISARQTFHLALQGLVQEGTISEGQALDMASAVLHDNAKAFYGGKL
jgi:hypothetical protein